MNEIDLTAVDLNLLVSLHALIEESSVTRAARRVHVSQSAMSHALGRLRDLFGDPLLVREGRGMVLTPRARTLAPMLRGVLRDASQLIAAHPVFDPTTSDREFTLLCPDVLGGVAPRLLAAVSEAAPNVRVRIQTPQLDLAEAVIDHGADLALTGPHAPVSGIVRRGIGELQWSVMRRRRHPLGDAELTAKAWTAWPHVLVESGNRGVNIVAAALEAAGLDRRIGVVLPSFLMAPHVVAESNFFYTMPLALAEPLAQVFDLVIAPPPIPIPTVQVSAIWPERLAADAGHEWFRELVIETLTRALDPADTRYAG